MIAFCRQCHVLSLMYNLRSQNKPKGYGVLLKQQPLDSHASATDNLDLVVLDYSDEYSSLGMYALNAKYGDDTGKVSQYSH